MTSRAEHDHKNERTARLCDKSRNEQQKSVLLAEHAKGIVQGAQETRISVQKMRAGRQQKKANRRP